MTSSASQHSDLLAPTTLPGMVSRQTCRVLYYFQIFEILRITHLHKVILIISQKFSVWMTSCLSTSTGMYSFRQSALSEYIITESPAVWSGSMESCVTCMRSRPEAATGAPNSTGQFREAPDATWALSGACCPNARTLRRTTATPCRAFARPPRHPLLLPLLLSEKPGSLTTCKGSTWLNTTIISMESWWGGVWFKFWS